MEDTNSSNSSLINEEDNNLAIGQRSTSYLNEIGKWTKFLSIIGFCMLGLIVLFSLFASTIFSQFDNGDMPFSGGFISVIYLIIGALYFFPIYYLYKFAIKIKEALVQKDNQSLDDAFENLKSHYKFVGIYMIVVLAIYLLFGGAALFLGSLF